MVISIMALAMLFIVSSSLIAFAIASSESPFIVAQKKASLTKLRDGSKRVSVAIDIYNKGSVCASTMKNISPDMMANMGEQIEFTLSKQDATKAQEAWLLYN